MHVLLLHQNFPAQFGHIAKHLVEKLKWTCTFLSQTPAGTVGGLMATTRKPSSASILDAASDPGAADYPYGVTGNEQRSRTL